MVGKERDGSKGSGLLSSVLAGRRGEDTGELVDERALGPETSGGIEKGARGADGTAIASGNSLRVSG